MKELLVLPLLFLIFSLDGKGQTEQWNKLELSFVSEKTYENPLYDLNEFYAVFTSPTGRTNKINGFWDGEQTFRIRFSPDELGTWTFHTSSSDKGLDQQTGNFECVPSSNSLLIYQKGAIQRSKGDYHLSYSDGTPFFFTACTAWNGALKSTEEEWEQYLSHRAENNYNVIQFVTTQWRGGSSDQYGEVAYTGSGKISVNTEFFKRMDEKVNRINAHGLVAAPVLLWALPVGPGKEISPGYTLPDAEAILLAKYMVARYGSNHVIWFLGGDGQYTDIFEQRWKTIGRGVFGEMQHPGVVAQHPRGSSWIGGIYKDEPWLDIVGYQSSHNNEQGVVDWINKGPMAHQWDKLPPRPLINLEPNYEEIGFRITAEDVRNASYWSIFATPLAGITYGANGIWPWIQKEGDLVENHGNPGGEGPTPWHESIDFPGSMQIGYLSGFVQQFDWWKLKPAPELLVEQPGNEVFNHFVPVVTNNDYTTLLAYTPIQQEIKIRNPRLLKYTAQWFDPINNHYLNAELESGMGWIAATPPSTQDYVLILKESSN
ncbi:MAG TPA: DUF4038 domain-containing protein [Cyclobacteriaceae bacterium]|nr:DUF4038 domain-containing protein [Cyclobacteriaceae bacterium]